MASLQLADLATGSARLPAATVFMMGGVAEQHRRQVKRLLKRLPDELPRTEGRAWRELRDLMEYRRVEAEADRPSVRTTPHAVPQPPSEAEPVPEAPSVRLEPIHPALAPGLTSPGPTTTIRPRGMSPRRLP